MIGSRKWRARARKWPVERDLSTQDRMCLDADTFPSVGDASADFYRHAIDIAWGVRSPILAAYHLTIVALVGLAIAALVWVAWQVTTNRLPVRDVRQELLTPAVPPGGRVKVEYRLNRLKPCAVDITASIIDGSGELRPLVTLHRDVSGPSGADHFLRSYEVPPEAASGASALRVGWAYACPGNYVSTFSPPMIALPDLPFVIAR